jgi:hypothetical protein
VVVALKPLFSFFVVSGWRGGGLQPPPQTGGVGKMSDQETVERKDLIVFEKSEKIVYLTFYKDADDVVRYIGGWVIGEITINLPGTYYRLLLRTTRRLPKIRHDEIVQKWKDLTFEAAVAVEEIDREQRAIAVALQEIIDGLRRLQQTAAHRNLVIRTRVWRFDRPEEDC